jgi:hypothetical protein
MPSEVSPQKFQQAVQRGVKRLARFRHARVHFIQEYAGAYYDKTSGEIGTRALNLIFNAIRVLVPTMVMNFPKHTIMTPYLQVRDYANLLGMALDQHDQKIDICNVYRRCIVDAIFTLGIMKTGLCQSDSVYALSDEEGHIDAGTVYTECVDFDNFVVDPNSKEHMFKDATFMGDRITVPRQVLLDSGLYKNDLIERLPRAGDEKNDRRAYALSMQGIQIDDNTSLEDDVEIIELWVPGANAIVTVPGAEEVTFEDYLRVDDYYGVKEGPYSLLGLMPPTPGNPLPVQFVGVLYDLHILANRMAKKIIEQAERQKDIPVYKRSAADDAEEVKNAGDGEGIAVEDPDAVKVLSFGGQQNSNERHLEALQGWFNMMAANPEQIGGQNVQANSATAANILQQNASIGLEDMKDLVYKSAAEEARRRAWFFHTDPLMRVPLIKRQPMPAQMGIDPLTGQSAMQPATMQEVQVILTPEARSGDFIDFTFRIEPESMGRVDSKVRLQQAMDLAQKILPAAMASAQVAMQLGIPFSAQAFILRMAKDAGIEWMDEVFYDPNFQMQLQQMQMMGPQMANSKGTPNLNPQMQQNGQPANVMAGQPDQQQQFHQSAQEGANEGQMMLRKGMTHAFDLGAAPKAPMANANAF